MGSIFLFCQHALTSSCCILQLPHHINRRSQVLIAKTDTDTYCVASCMLPIIGREEGKTRYDYYSKFRFVAGFGFWFYITPISA